MRNLILQLLVLPGRVAGLLLICTSLLLLAAPQPCCFGMQRGDMVMRDYPMAVGLPHKRLEISADYLLMNDTVDVFDIRDSEFSGNRQLASLGDLQGARLLVNYGLFQGTTLQGAYTYRDMQYQSAAMQVHSVDFSIKQSIIGPARGFPFWLAVDGGLRINTANDMVSRDEDEMNDLIRRVGGSDVSVDLTDTHVWFNKDTESASFSLGVPRDGRPAPWISIESMYDATPFLRLTAGRRHSVFFPNAYVEVGRSFIESAIDSSLTAYFPQSIASHLPEMPLSLNREENYLAAGVAVMVQLPFCMTAAAEYRYLSLLRDDGLDAADDNHIIKADLVIPITRRSALALGGTYYNRQFNGIIPFLYNKYSQTTFDHPYGVIHIGVTCLLGQ